MIDMEMTRQSEKAGSQEDIPRQSPSRVPSPAQDAQLNAKKEIKKEIGPWMAIHTKSANDFAQEHAEEYNAKLMVFQTFGVKFHEAA
ncbi:Uncharacterized protein HZ326_20485 [Fusarium oxysporum f. sp. albedinis]|nr:Uncharacterized protein HZ326_25655 [Fusarium oxysporum f. sp. albedinis]KAJ0136510.1 Uncharacterized protein HZ326_20485 [Fusarium oxysporum f. sp. albedinis]